jgi:hypothetical protein
VDRRERTLRRLAQDLRSLAENNRHWEAREIEGSFMHARHGGKAIAYERAAEWLEEILGSPWEQE